MTTQFIYFDLGVVLLDFDHEKGCRQVSQVCGCSPEQAKAAIFGSGLEDQFETGLVEPAEFHQVFSTATGTTSRREEFLQACGDIFSPNVAMIEILKRVIQAEIPIGLLSNTCDAHWSWVKQKFPLINESFPVPILSYEVQSMKPDRKIYEAAISACGWEPESILFVDDKIENVEGAVSAGIDAVLYTSADLFATQLRERGLEF